MIWQISYKLFRFPKLDVEEIANQISDKILYSNGYIESVVTEVDPKLSRKVIETTSLITINESNSGKVKIYKANADGLLTKVYKTIEAIIIDICSKNPKTWTDIKPAIVAACNAAYNPVIRDSPISLIHFHDYRAPWAI